MSNASPKKAAAPRSRPGPKSSKPKHEQEDLSDDEPVEEEPVKRPIVTRSRPGPKSSKPINEQNDLTDEERAAEEAAKQQSLLEACIKANIIREREELNRRYYLKHKPSTLTNEMLSIVTTINQPIDIKKWLSDVDERVVPLTSEDSLSSDDFTQEFFNREKSLEESAAAAALSLQPVVVAPAPEKNEPQPSCSRTPPVDAAPPTKKSKRSATVTKRTEETHL